ncbi:MAG: hypothetical protein AAF236_07980 [Verrucomicrobiota bacterium]
MPEPSLEDAAEEMVDEHYDALPELNLNVGHDGLHPSRVNVWVAGGIGFLAAVIWYVIMFLLPSDDVAKSAPPPPQPTAEESEAAAEEVLSETTEETAEREESEAKRSFVGYIKALFTERGWSQYVTTLLMFWCAALLVLKLLNIQRQRRAMLLQALPEDISEEINVNNLKDFHDNLINYPKILRNTYIVNRVRKALEFFYVRQNNPEVAQMITSQSEVDAAKVNNSYAVIKVFLWAIPIMGFIGTVLGIGNAIGGFGAVFAAGDSGGGDMSEISGPLLDVLDSRGVAFDTTLLALVFSIILSFPASALQSSEDDLLSDVDDYCVDNLLKRLNDGGAASNTGSDAGLLKAIGDAIASNQKDVMGRFESVQKSMSENLGKQTENYAEVAKAIDTQIEAIAQRAEKYETRLDEDFFKNLERMRTDSVGAIQGQVSALATGIQNLNEVLGELNGKQVVVKKRGLFSRG